MNKTAAIIGGGVIGGGWLARFLLNGWDIKLFDPDPEAERKIGDVLKNARHALPMLYETALPKEGRLTVCKTVQEAVADADWIQESVPERLDIKHKVFAEIQTHCRPDAIIGSSTSGFKPSELQQNAQRPEQIMVTHPFNPVYLLPLIEVVPSDQTGAQHVEKAKEILTSVGLYPLHVRKEIDAHIADRFLEAVWREGLWLIKDGIATTEELDDAITYGPGLRWAIMGTCLTFHLAGGTGGMRHMLEQFGPALKLPWTHLEAPELTDELIDRMVTGTEEQAAGRSVEELERLRDDCLIDIMRALERYKVGAGALIKDR